jgi:hypothetical protein
VEYSPSVLRFEGVVSSIHALSSTYCSLIQRSTNSVKCCGEMSRSILMIRIQALSRSALLTVSLFFLLQVNKLGQSPLESDYQSLLRCPHHRRFKMAITVDFGGVGFNSTVMGGPLPPVLDPVVMVQTITAGSTTGGVAPFTKQKKKNRLRAPSPSALLCAVVALLHAATAPHPRTWRDGATAGGRCRGRRGRNRRIRKQGKWG